MAAPAAAIAGIHEFEKRVAGGLSPLQIKAECAARALEDAGLTWADVDAVYDASEAGRMQGLTIAEYLGVVPRVVDTTAVGGSSYEFHAAHAARDIAAGKANVALLTYGSTAHSDSRAIGTGPRPPDPQPSANMERPYGLTLIGNYAMVARRHMAQYGTTPEQLAAIAVTTRRHATRNPQAVTGLADIGIKNNGEITVDDVLGSRLIADPLHLLECCIVSDGGGAVVIVSRAVAAGIRTRPAWILGTGEAVGEAEGDGRRRRGHRMRRAARSAAGGEGGNRDQERRTDGRGWAGQSAAGEQPLSWARRLLMARGDSRLSTGRRNAGRHPGRAARR